MFPYVIRCIFCLYRFPRISSPECSLWDWWPFKLVYNLHINWLILFWIFIFNYIKKFSNLFLSSSNLRKSYLYNISHDLYLTIFFYSFFNFFDLNSTLYLLFSKSDSSYYSPLSYAISLALSKYSFSEISIIPWNCINCTPKYPYFLGSEINLE